MKIFYYFKELDTPMYRWQRVQIFNELKRYDIHFVTFNPLKYTSKKEANDRALEEIRKNHYDAFLTCLGGEFFYSSMLQEISKMGLPMILFCPDNLELPYVHKSIVPYFDIIWLTSWETQYLFEEWGAKKIVFQTYAANPYLYRPQ